MNATCLSEARITAAVIRLNNGEIFEGPSTHFQAMKKIAEAGYFDWPGITSPGTQDDADTFDPYEALAQYQPEDGWMTNEGVFVDRAAAEDIARQAGQTTQYQGSLHSGGFEIDPNDDEFDDLDKMTELKVIRYPYGTKVRVLTGKYAGEPGVVKEPTSFLTAEEGDRNYWVHLDNDEDPLSAIVYRPDQIQRIVNENEDEEDELAKEIGQGYPRFEFEPFGSVVNRHITLVKVNNEVIGTLTKKVIGGPDQVEWYIVYVANRQIWTHVRVSGPEEGAQQLWQDRLDLIVLPEIKPPHEPLVPPEGEPGHYENLRKKAKNLVSLLSENEDEDDFDEVKEYNYDQLQMIVHTLKAAGFNIIVAERHEDELILKFSWPATNIVAYMNGWRRAQEIVKPYMTLRQHNYAVNKEMQYVPGRGNELIAIALIRKRIEDDPGLWKVIPTEKAGNFNALYFWHDVIFSDHKVGEAYLPSFGPPGDMAERLREELVELHKILPFYPHGWQAPGNAFGEGPAIEWWRRNRTKLKDPDKNIHYFDRKLIGD